MKYINLGQFIYILLSPVSTRMNKIVVEDIISIKFQYKNTISISKGKGMIRQFSQHIMNIKYQDHLASFLYTKGVCHLFTQLKKHKYCWFELLLINLKIWF